MSRLTTTVSLAVLLLALLLGGYIYYSRDYVIYCLKGYDHSKSDYTIRRHDYHQLCKDYFMFEGNNNVFPKVINYIHSSLFNIDDWKKDKSMDLSLWYKSQEGIDVKSRLQYLKYAYTALYISTLLVLLAFIKVTMEVVIQSLLNKILLFFFTVVVADLIIFSILKLDLQIKWMDDVHKIIDNIKTWIASSLRNIN